MDTDWKKKGPIVIGGMGGSGTRLVAEICSLFGIYLGDDLNIASDNLFYTLLFRRRIWFYKTYQDQKEINVGLSLLKKLLLKRYLLTPRELWFLLYATADMSLHYRDERTWAFKRLFSILRYPRFVNPSFQGWGWKEPNSYLLIQQLSENFGNLKFIHTIRHGLDMAFSKNQRQMKAWGERFGISNPEKEADIPPASLKYWLKVNNITAKYGNILGDNHYLQINFDSLCQNPQDTIDDIISFLELKIDPDTYQKALLMPQVPESVGRYKDQDLTQFDPDDLTAVRKFGFLINSPNQDDKKQNKS
jgi:hypothetical protein